MPTECRPPPNTAPGTVCVLTTCGVSYTFWWDGRDWHVREGNPFKTSPSRMFVLGWRFVRVVEGRE